MYIYKDESERLTFSFVAEVGEEAGSGHLIFCSDLIIEILMKILDP